MKQIRHFLLVFFSALLLWNCDETELLDETGKLEVTDFNLPDNLPEGYHYEGWLLLNGTFVSVGNITNDSIINGRARFSDIETSDLAMADAFAITVENSASPAPSNYVLLVGDFNGNTADLTSNTNTSNGIITLGNKISAAYTLQNATVPPEQAGDYTQNGVWFFKGSGLQAESTISLYYDEIKYQAWLETNIDGATRYLDMGVISSDTLKDASNVYTQYNLNIPDFAGEDFLTKPDGETFPDNFFPKNVTGSKLIITPIFSTYLNHELPFPIFLLESEIPLGAVNDLNVTYEMQLNTNFSAKATKL